jgi:hypothetical protein
MEGLEFDDCNQKESGPFITWNTFLVISDVGLFFLYCDSFNNL